MQIGVEVSIHAPRVGERPADSEKRLEQATFQSTLPAWGSDRASKMPGSVTQQFQSTLPAWGSDRGPGSGARARPGFNPRSPRGGATIARSAGALKWRFQSTLPAWGSDLSVARRRRYARVSIHAPRVGERPGNAASGNRQAGFNPRSPRGGATSVDRIAAQIYTVSIHAPRVGERRFCDGYPSR